MLHAPQDLVLSQVKDSDATPWPAPVSILGLKEREEEAIAGPWGQKCRCRGGLPDRAVVKPCCTQLSLTRRGGGGKQHPHPTLKSPQPHSSLSLRA